ncbi:hypothetical protein ABZP36_026518 [Zizania latifolia]
MKERPTASLVRPPPSTPVSRTEARYGESCLSDLDAAAERSARTPTPAHPLPDDILLLPRGWQPAPPVRYHPSPSRETALVQKRPKASSLHWLFRAPRSSAPLG